MYELAGIVGIDPGPLTLRQLLWMVEAGMRQAWNHTSSVMALIANVNRDPKRKPTPFKAEEFNPYAARKKKGGPVTAEEWGSLKSAFEKKR